VLLEVDRLLVEEKHAVPAERVLQFIDFLGRERPPQVDAADLGADVG
jgi:hypothetical protein